MFAGLHAEEAFTPEPLLKGTLGTETGVHGAGNVYAPEVRRAEDGWRMWYGAQGRDGHDRICAASAANGRAWRREGVVIDEPGVNHQNDPSVVRVQGQWWMFYTRAARGIEDEIAAATSDDGIHWTLRGVVLGPQAGAWDSLVVSRPSVLHDGAVFRMWYDARGLRPEAAPPSPERPETLLAAATERAVGYAESNDGLHWRRRDRPVFEEGAGAVHVRRVAGRHVMLIESHDGTRIATSPDGLDWRSHGLLIRRTGADLDRGGRVTPFLDCADDGSDAAVFAGVNAGDWSRNQIVRFPLAPGWLERLSAP